MAISPGDKKLMVVLAVLVAVAAGVFLTSSRRSGGAGQAALLLGVGDTFAGDFQLAAVVGSCADFLYRDQSFTLCETTGK